MGCQEETHTRLVKKNAIREKKKNEIELFRASQSGFFVKMGLIPAQIVFRMIQSPVRPLHHILDVLVNVSGFQQKMGNPYGQGRWP